MPRSEEAYSLLGTLFPIPCQRFCLLNPVTMVKSFVFEPLRVLNFNFVVEFILKQKDTPFLYLVCLFIQGENYIRCKIYN